MIREELATEYKNLINSVPLKMPPLIYTTATSEKDLFGIIERQRNNLPVNLTPEEILEQGFVTVIHSMEDVKKMNDIEQHIICKDGEDVVAYLLAMTSRSKNDIPVLVPMFELFENLYCQEKSISTYNYMVVGQACMHKNYRILDKCYEPTRTVLRKNMILQSPKL